MELIIGSTAIKHHFPDFKREPKDLDIAVLKQRKREGNKEFLVNPIILKYQKEGYLVPNLLLSLKISHMFWDFNWDKHMFDIQFLLAKGCTYDVSLIDKLRDFWEIHLPKIRRSKLDQNKADFFKNSVNEDSDQHDYYHSLIADIPAYTKILKDDCEVDLDFNKWEKLSFEEKCDVVQEEAYVMATERHRGINYRVAYKRQLNQNIIKHYPQKIAIFAIENYIKLERPKFDYMKLINSKIKCQKV